MVVHINGGKKLEAVRARSPPRQVAMPHERTEGHVTLDAEARNQLDRQAGRLAETMLGVGADRANLASASVDIKRRAPPDRRFRFGLPRRGDFSSIQDGA
jgi:hypothetical protein